MSDDAVQPPPLPQPDGRDRAVRHVTEQTRTYPCEACAAPLAFAPERQELLCGSCGTAYPVEADPDARIVKHDLQSTVDALPGRAAGLASLGGGEHQVVCQSCGGHTIFNGSLTATRCPYCATPIQRDDVQDSPERLPLDAVLPLRVGEPQAREAIEKWIDSRRFAPREFKRYRSLGSFTSVYMSYFTYDADATTHYEGRRGDDYTVTVGSGENRRTERRTRWRSVSGTVHDSFRDLPDLANTGMDEPRMRELEPWPIGDAVAYTPEYVAGHLSRTYDRDPAQVFAESTRPRIDDQVKRTVERDIGGDHQRISGMQTTFGLLQFMYLLLPVWLLSVEYNGKPFQVLVNGMTGEVQGDRPWSAVKIAATVIAALIVVAVVAYLIASRS